MPLALDSPLIDWPQRLKVSTRLWTPSLGLIHGTGILAMARLGHLHLSGSTSGSIVTWKGNLQILAWQQRAAFLPATVSGENHDNNVGGRRSMQRPNALGGRDTSSVSLLGLKRWRTGVHGSPPPELWVQHLSNHMARLPPA